MGLPNPTLAESSCLNCAFRSHCCEYARAITCFGTQAPRTTSCERVIVCTMFGIPDETPRDQASLCGSLGLAQGSERGASEANHIVMCMDPFCY